MMTESGASDVELEDRVDPPDSTARWEDYVDVFFSPADLFRRRAHDRLAPPLITLLVASVVLYIALIPANRLIVAAATPDDPQAAAFMEQYGTLLQLFGMVFVPVTLFVMVAFGALLLWLGARVAGHSIETRRALLVSTYAAFVLLIAQIVQAGLVLLHADGTLDIDRTLSVGPLRLIGREWGEAAVPLLRRFEVFAVWQAILWGIGMRWVTPMPANRAALVAGLAWAVYAIPTFLFALITGGAAGPGGPAH